LVLPGVGLACSCRNCCTTACLSNKVASRCDCVPFDSACDLSGLQEIL
jgi:hypothetical protein